MNKQQAIEKSSEKSSEKSFAGQDCFSYLVMP
jgi:hypothetical protein